MNIFFGVVGVVGDVMDGIMSAQDMRTTFEPVVGTATTDVLVSAYEEFLASSKTESDQESFLKVVYQLFGIAEGADYSTTDSGQYCYCQMTDYMPAGGDKSKVMSAPWVFYVDDGSADDCAVHCAYFCADSLYFVDPDDRVFRGAVFGSLGATAADTCDANEIEITWTDADPADVSANNAGMCTFGGDIRTPVRAATKPGKTFKGWKFDNAK